VLLTNHVLSGALIGALSRRPVPAFAAGVVSHFGLLREFCDVSR
jgi:hypothetical protein